MKFEQNIFTLLFYIFLSTGLSAGFASAQELFKDTSIDNLASSIEKSLNENGPLKDIPFKNFDEQNQENTSSTMNPSAKTIGESGLDEKLSGESAFDYLTDNDNLESESISQKDKDLEKYGYNQEIAKNSIGIEISVESPLMRDARIYSIDEATSFAISEFMDSINIRKSQKLIDELSSKYIDKILIVDEFYDKKTHQYTGYFDVWLNTEMAKKHLIGNNIPSEDATAELNLQGPEWVLLVPSVVTSENQWGLDDRNSEWTNVWKIPTSLGKTQIISTRGDSDDRNQIKRATSMHDITSFLAEKYNANHILFSSFNENTNELQILYWDSDYQKFNQYSKKLLNTSLTVEKAKDLTLDLFLKALLDEEKLDKITSEENQESVQSNAMQYLIIGKPKFTSKGANLHLQVIKDEDVTFPKVDNILRAADNIVMLAYKNKTNSILLELLVKDAASENKIKVILQENGFEKYRF